MNKLLAMQTRVINPLAAMQEGENALMNRMKIQEIQEAQQQRALGRERENRLMSVLSSGPENETVEQRGNRLIRSGFEPEGSAMLKQAAEFDGKRATANKANAEADMERFKIAKGRAEWASQTAGSLLSDPNLTPDKIATVLADGVQRGILDRDATLKEVQALPSMTLDQARSWLQSKQEQALSVKEQIELAAPQIIQRNIGGQSQVLAIDRRTGGVRLADSTQNTATPDAVMSDRRQREEGAQNRAVQIRGQNMSDSRAREANSLAREAARTQIVNDDKLGLILVDKGTSRYRSALSEDGKPIEGKETRDAKAREGQIAAGIAQARDLLGKRPTGSFAGAGVDLAGRAVGIGSKSADAAAQLETLSGWLTANVPRMEGPQSNVDVQLYQRMAANVGDRTQTISSRLEALKTLEQLQAKYSQVRAGNAPQRRATDAQPASPAAQSRPSLESFQR